MNLWTEALEAGRAFFLCDYATLGGGATRRLMLATPTEDSAQRLCIDIYADADVTVTLSEGSDKTPGTGLTESNADRNSSKTPAMTVTHTPTGGSTDGTALLKFTTPSGGNVTQVFGGGFDEKRAITLKRNKKYVIALTDVAGGANVSTVLHWIEEVRFTHTTTTTTTTTTSTTSTTTAP
jgi:hypothetical protein